MPQPRPTPPYSLVARTQAFFSETLITSLLSFPRTRSLSRTVRSSITDRLSAIIFLCFTCAGRAGAQWFTGQAARGAALTLHLLLSYQEVAWPPLCLSHLFCKLGLMVEVPTS